MFPIISVAKHTWTWIEEKIRAHIFIFRKFHFYINIFETYGGNEITFYISKDFPEQDERDEFFQV